MINSFISVALTQIEALSVALRGNALQPGMLVHTCDLGLSLVSRPASKETDPLFCVCSGYCSHLREQLPCLLVEHIAS